MTKRKNIKESEIWMGKLRTEIERIPDEQIREALWAMFGLIMSLDTERDDAGGNQ